MLDPIYLSEAFYAWGFRTKFFRQLFGAAGFAVPAFFLQPRLYTNVHAWTWWAELAGFVLCLLPALALGAYALANLLRDILALFRRPAAFLKRLPWDRVFSTMLFAGIAVVAYANIAPGYDQTVASTAGVIAASAAIIASMCYFGLKGAWHFGPLPRYAAEEPR